MNPDWKELFEIYMKRKASKSPLKPFSKREIHLMKKAFESGHSWREWYENKKRSELE